MAGVPISGAHGCGGAGDWHAYGTAEEGTHGRGLS